MHFDIYDIDIDIDIARMRPSFKLSLADYSIGSNSKMHNHTNATNASMNPIT